MGPSSEASKDVFSYHLILQMKFFVANSMNGKQNLRSFDLLIKRKKFLLHNKI